MGEKVGEERRTVKNDTKAREQVDYVKLFAINAACEAIQVAAMCQKFLEMEEAVD